MRSILSFLLVLVCFVATQSFQCGRPYSPKCDNYKSDTVLLNVSVLNPATQYHLFDTIWLTSTISDSFSPLSGSPVTFTQPMEQMSLTAVPYSINTSGTLPVMQYAFIEFNPVVKDGNLQSPGYSGFNYNYRRLAPNNTLQAGFVPGRTGLYIIELMPGNYYNSGSFYIYNGNDYCTTYFGESALPLAQQNQGYWTTLGVSSISMAPNYGSKIITKGSRNYFIFKVIP